MGEISRRTFLAGGALTIGGWALLPARANAAEESDVNRFVLMADSHVCADQNKMEHECNPDQTFQQAVKDILELKPRPAALIVAGDCVYLHGRKEDYEALKEFLGPLLDAGIATLLVMGNHDNREAFHEVFPDAAILHGSSLADRRMAVYETNHADWFLLDSLEKTNFTPGTLGEGQLKWLAEQLDKNPSKPALLVAHHGPEVSPGDHRLTDTGAFLKVVSPRKQAKCYFFGHSHEWSLSKRDDGMHFVNLPANGWLFDDKQPRGFVDAEIGSDGINLTLHCLNRTDARHGEKHELKWRS